MFAKCQDLIVADINLNASRQVAYVKIFSEYFITFLFLWFSQFACVRYIVLSFRLFGYETE